MDESKKKIDMRMQKVCKIFRWCKDVQYGNDKISRSG